MKNYILLLFIVLYSTYSSGQCDLIEKASKAYCEQDYELVISILENFKTTYPKTNITTNIDYQLGMMYLEKKDYITSEAIFKKIIQDSLQINYPDEKIVCDFEEQMEKATDDKNYCIYLNSFILENDRDSFWYTKKYTLHSLSKIYKETNQFEMALQYLNEASYYYTSFGCGNASRIDKMHRAASYGDIYLKMNQPQRALEELLPVALDMLYVNKKSNHVVKLSYEVLLSLYTTKQLQEAFNRSIKNIEITEELDSKGQTITNYHINFMDLNLIVYKRYPGAKEVNQTDIERKLESSGLHALIFS